MFLFWRENQWTERWSLNWECFKVSLEMILLTIKIEWEEINKIKSMVTSNEDAVQVMLVANDADLTF